MLLPSYLIRVADPIVQIYEILNIWAVQEIARSISENSEEILANGARNMRLMNEWGMPAATIVKGVSRLSGLSEIIVQGLIKDALSQSIGADFSLFHKGGRLIDLTPEKYMKSERFTKLIREWEHMTNGELQDFCRVLPESGDAIFREACDQAFMQSRAGIITKDKAIIKSIDYCADMGLRYVNYADHKGLEIESAVRTAVTTGINRAAASCTLLECQDAGIRHVVVTAHLGARVNESDPIANHAGWQGKVYRIDDYEERLPGSGTLIEDRTGLVTGRENLDEYPSLREATGYPDNPLGLGGYNCRHNFYPYIPGVSVNNMLNIDGEENKEIYEATQVQRKMEREMRRTRRRLEAQKAALEVCPEEMRETCKKQVQHHQQILDGQYQRYKLFSESKGLQTQMQRTYTAKQQQVFKKLNQ